MAHQHSVYDTDLHFKIDPVTREIKKTAVKAVIIQGDHNSERFTFEIPRFVEEHDMTLCTDIKIHYLNVSADKSQTSADVYLVEDMTISPESDDIVIFSWLLSRNAAAYAGSLNFAICFECNSENGNEYTWRTGTNSNVIVSESINNADIVVEEYSDILLAWERRLFYASYDGVLNIEEATTAALAEIENAKGSINNDFSNALKGVASGEIVAIKDASPVKHDLKVKVSSKNLLVYPYGESTKTRGSVEFAVSDDGRVTANGTATSGAYIYLIARDKPLALKAGTYTFSIGNMADSQTDVRLRVWVSTNGTEKTEDIYSSRALTFNSDVVLASALLSVNEGIKADNLVFEPQIEPNATKTAYTPYIADTGAAKIKAQGANILDIDKLQGTINGVFTKENDIYTLSNIGDQRSTQHFPLYIPVNTDISASVKHIEVSIANGVATNGTVFIQFFDIDKNAKDGIQLKADAPMRTIRTTAEIHYVRLYLTSYTSDGDFVRFKDLQLELGAATDYEPYIEPVEYAQGEDIKSAYPSMTITTDTAGALVEVEYNRDLNKAFAELAAMMASIASPVTLAEE